jgi:quinohemoprotein ethanol dehydrogenase
VSGGEYQVSPGDEWDFDAAQQLTLADLTRGAPQRHVLMQANKNGFFRVLDRTTCSRYIAQPAMDLVR